MHLADSGLGGILLENLTVSHGSPKSLDFFLVLIIVVIG